MLLLLSLCPQSCNFLTDNNNNPESHPPRVVDQHREGAKPEDSQSAEQLFPALHLEGAGIFEGQSRREEVGLLHHHRPGGRGNQQPPGQLVTE